LEKRCNLGILNDLSLGVIGPAFFSLGRFRRQIGLDRFHHALEDQSYANGSDKNSDEACRRAPKLEAQKLSRH
jgi:hypothetical protein